MDSIRTGQSPFRRLVTAETGFGPPTPSVAAFGIRDTDRETTCPVHPTPPLGESGEFVLRSQNVAIFVRTTALHDCQPAKNVCFVPSATCAIPSPPGGQRLAASKSERSKDYRDHGGRAGLLNAIRHHRSPLGRSSAFSGRFNKGPTVFRHHRHRPLTGGVEKRQRTGHVGTIDQG